MKAEIQALGIEINLQKQGKERLKLEKREERGAAAIYFFQGESAAAQLTIEKKANLQIGSLELRVAAHAFRESDSLAANAALIELSFAPQPRRLTAMYLHKDWWTRPFFAESFRRLPERTQVIYLEQGCFVMPAGELFKADACSGEGKGLHLRLTAHQAGRNEIGEKIFVFAEAEQIYEGLQNAFAEIAGWKGIPLAARRRYPEMFEYLGWCSWDAFYTDINEEKIRAKAAELKEKSIPARWMLLDDGWLSVREQKLYELLPEKEKFPEGFAKLTADIRSGGMIQKIGVWHALAGYWGGLEEGSGLAERMKEHLYKTLNGKLVPHPSMERGFGFYRSWYQMLCSQGIDFVKVDGQSAVKNYFEGGLSVCEAAKGLHEALDAAAALTMDGNLINCMGMAMENIISRPLTAISRNSDDFMPSEEISFAEHLLQNAYNAPYHNTLYHCDWDMFWTSHTSAEKHALLRAISGGPIYFSDRLGESRREILEPLVYSDGRILRMQRAAMPSPDCILTDPEKEGLLKLTNTGVYARNGMAGAIAVYNISQEKRSTVLSSSDIHDLAAGSYLLYDWRKGAGMPLAEGEKHSIEMAPQEWRLYLLLPLGQEITPIGLTDKYISFHALEEINSGACRQTLLLHEGGEFSFYCGEKRVRIQINGEDRSDQTVYEQGVGRIALSKKEKVFVAIEW